MEEDLMTSSALERKFNSMKAERASVDALRWEACAYMAHRIGTSSLNTSPVPKIRLYNSYAIASGQKFIDGFIGNIMSQNQRWFTIQYQDPSFRDADDITGANSYFDKVSQRVNIELSHTNFYPENNMAFKDSWITGCSAMFIQNNPKLNMTSYKCLAPWTWWIDCDEWGNTDTFFYEYYMQAGKAYEKFGDKLPKDKIEIAKKDPYDKYFTLLMCIFPRNRIRNYDGTELFTDTKKYACIDVLEDSYQIVSEGGYDHFPVIVHQYESNGDNIYGTSPVIKYLPELRKLNKLSYELGLSIAKVNHSPYVIPNELKDKFSDDPESRIYVSTMDQSPQPLKMQQSPQYANDMVTNQEEKISKLFYNDLFDYLMRQDKVFTATQVNEIKSEELSLLSATFGDTQKKMIDPTLKYVIYLMGKNGRIPQAPRQLFQDKSNQLCFVLNSVLANSLQSYMLRDSCQSTLELTQTLKQLQMTDELDNIETDELVRNIMKGNATPASVMRDKAKVLEIRNARQQQQQELLNQQKALNQSEMVRNLGGASNVNNSQGKNQYT